jgi:hypothetical protein
MNANQLEAVVIGDRADGLRRIERAIEIAGGMRR